MRALFQNFKNHFSFSLLSFVFLFGLFNPVFKKFDYGAGWPVVMLLAVALMFASFYDFKKKREFHLHETIFLGVYLVFVGLSFVFSSAKNVGLSEVVATFSVIGLYQLYAYSKIDWMEKFLKVVVSAAVLSVVIGYFMYFFEVEDRMYGPFFNILYHANEWPNAFALFLLMAWPLVLFFVEKKKEMVSALLVGVLLSGILLTFSRGAFIALIGQTVLILIFFLKNIKFKQFLMGILAALFAVVLFFGANFVRSFGHEVLDVGKRAAFEGTAITSGQERVDFWLGAIKLASEKPALGWGPFSFRQAYAPIQKHFLATSDHPHNFFLKIAAENGVIALLTFLAFLATFVIDVESRWKELTAIKRKQIIILGISILGGLAHSFIDYNFNFVANLMLWFLLLAFIKSLSMPRMYKEKKALFSIFIAVFVGLLAIYEGGLLFASTALKNDEALSFSFYPRDYYLTHDLEKHLSMNPLDARAHILNGEYEKALEIDPMNQFLYYREYLWRMDKSNLSKEDWAIINKTKLLILDYYKMVDQNVHYTAYTKNVEYAAEVADELVSYLPQEEVYDLIEGKRLMLEKASKLRAEK